MRKGSGGVLRQVGQQNDAALWSRGVQKSVGRGWIRTKRSTDKVITEDSGVSEEPESDFGKGYSQRIKDILTTTTKEDG